MIRLIRKLRHSLILKMVIVSGTAIFLSIFTLSYFSIRKYEQSVMEDILSGADRLSTTIKLGTHYAMLLNSRDDIAQIIQNIGRQRDITNTRIYNKDGQIKFSNSPAEVDMSTNIKAEACDVCHRTNPPLVNLELEQRTRIFEAPDGTRLLGIISPIYNEPSCTADPCHFHPEGKEVLGALDVVISLANADKDIAEFKLLKILLALCVFLVTASTLMVTTIKFVRVPIKQLISGTQRIARGHGFEPVRIEQDDEVGRLARSINSMGSEILQKQAELNQQRDEYQNLFELVPCIITVQDRNYRLIRYNREFKDKFNPRPGDFCFHAYKGRLSKCEVCPVEKTFLDGKTHISEETGFKEDGTRAHWIVTTSPIRNAAGEIVAAMEVSLDITRRKELEEKVESSEKKLFAIFSNIPNPVFVLDMETLQVLDLNESVKTVYGYDREETVGRSFLDFFLPSEREHYAGKLKKVTVINQVKHLNREGGPLFVEIRVSPSEYLGHRVLLVTTSDITKRLETEQQLIQASKMATLGEMATGVAHELNQPLSVIKTASSFFMSKIKRGEKIREEILETMAQEIDGYVDRATRIINHLREFGRKSDLTLERVNINTVIQRAFEIFSQQLKLREIEVKWRLDSDIPAIMADPGRLEQVFINLLINARDAIEERWESGDRSGDGKKITLTTFVERQRVVAVVSDTGKGIPRSIRDRLFEPFFTTKEVGKGTGLGLSISYGIVTDFGGSIQAQSHSGRGATFILSFPIVREE